MMSPVGPLAGRVGPWREGRPAPDQSTAAPIRGCDRRAGRPSAVTQVPPDGSGERERRPAMRDRRPRPRIPPFHALAPTCAVNGAAAATEAVRRVAHITSNAAWSAFLVVNRAARPVVSTEQRGWWGAAKATGSSRKGGGVRLRSAAAPGLPFNDPEATGRVWIITNTDATLPPTLFVAPFATHPVSRLAAVAGRDALCSTRGAYVQWMHGAATARAVARDPTRKCRQHLNPAGLRGRCTLSRPVPASRPLPPYARTNANCCSWLGWRSAVDQSCAGHRSCFPSPPCLRPDAVSREARTSIRTA